MANKPISMSKIRQIVKLHARGTGKRTIARTLGMSKNTVKVYLDKYSLLQTPADELLKLCDYELNNLFHPPELIPLTEKLKQLHEFFPRMEKKLGRRGMTISMQFGQYLAEYPY